jgi:hypothetical protein
MANHSPSPLGRGLGRAAGKTLRAGWFHVLWFWNPTGATASTRADIARRTNPAHIRLPQFSKQDPSKIDLPSAPISGFDPHRKSYEGFSHESLSALPPDFSVGPDTTHCPPLGITHHRLAGLHRFGPIQLRGRSLAKGLMRTDSVVYPHPTMDAPLLRPQVPRGRSGRFALEHTMHLFVRPVLFWMSWGDEFDSNSQGPPPRAQSRQPSRAFGSKGTAIVHPDHTGIAVSRNNRRKIFRTWLQL